MAISGRRPFIVGAPNHDRGSNYGRARLPIYQAKFATVAIFGDDKVYDAQPPAEPWPIVFHLVAATYLALAPGYVRGQRLGGC